MNATTAESESKRQLNEGEKIDDELKQNMHRLLDVEVRTNFVSEGQFDYITLIVPILINLRETIIGELHARTLLFILRSETLVRENETARKRRKNSKKALHVETLKTDIERFTDTRHCCLFFTVVRFYLVLDTLSNANVIGDDSKIRENMRAH